MNSVFDLTAQRRQEDHFHSFHAEQSTHLEKLVVFEAISTPRSTIFDASIKVDLPKVKAKRGAAQGLDNRSVSPSHKLHKKAEMHVRVTTHEIGETTTGAAHPTLAILFSSGLHNRH